MVIFPLTMIENTFTFRRADREMYRAGKLFPKWKQKYGPTMLFRAIKPDSRQVPPYGFGELMVGMHYLDMGFEVFWTDDGTDPRWWPKAEADPGYLKTLAVLGEDATRFVCRSHPQPPDLIVFDRRNRFFLVEVKLPGDRLTDGQKQFFPNIERYLARMLPKAKRSQHLPRGHWFELMRLRVEKRIGSQNAQELFDGDLPLFENVS